MRKPKVILVLKIKSTLEAFVNKSIKLENIIAYVKEHDIDFIDSKYVLYGRMDTSALNLFLLGGLGALTMKQFVIIFGENQLTLILLTLPGDFKEKAMTILYEDIFKITFKEGILVDVFTFYIEDRKFKVKCNKKIVGMSWQSENLKTCLEHPIMTKHL
ncbi:hypothetical protein LQF63_03330 [Tetragenococcus koreensis]|uniref:hypothetical protein n=1 Tax=Tetragenococcus koreensis TaxID=290335 RepID=UPI001F41D3E7|nr:hypothetical protein [Tetragenococcus koreensis]MCF1616693.1 hypothetical protein [Tetragenococcus koreensis]